MKNKRMFLTITMIALLVIIAITFILSLNKPIDYSEYITLPDYKNIVIEDVETYTYTEEDVYDTIRADILAMSDVVPELNTPITEDSYVKFKLTLEGQSMEIGYDFPSDLLVFEEVITSLLGKSKGDVYTVSVNQSNGSGEITEVEIEILSVLPDPLDYFTDKWVKEYEQSMEDLLTIEDYVTYIEDVLTNNIDDFVSSDVLMAFNNELLKQVEYTSLPDDWLEDEVEYWYAEDIYLKDSFNYDRKSDYESSGESYADFVKEECAKTVLLDIMYRMIAEQEDLVSEVEFKGKLQSYRDQYKDTAISEENTNTHCYERRVYANIVSNWLYANIQYTAK